MIAVGVRVSARVLPPPLRLLLKVLLLKVLLLLLLVLVLPVPLVLRLQNLAVHSPAVHWWTKY